MVASSAPGSGQNAPIPGSGGSHVQPEKLPSLLIERPKMPRATWEALRNHVVRERQRKKLEREQSAEVSFHCTRRTVTYIFRTTINSSLLLIKLHNSYHLQYERQKKEREHKKKQEALTLEDTKVEIANLERKLDELKAEKTQLFHTLKKVLYEDDRRRSKEVTQGGQVYLQPSVRPGPSAHYMKPHPHLLLSAAPPPPQAPLPQAAPKRPRTPSPPRSSISSAYYRNPPAAAKYYGAAPNSAIASVSATHIYAMTGTSGGAQGYASASPAVTSAGSASKPLYLSQQQAAVQSRYVWREHPFSKEFNAKAFLYVQICRRGCRCGATAATSLPDVGTCRPSRRSRCQTVHGQYPERLPAILERILSTAGGGNNGCRGTSAEPEVCLCSGSAFGNAERQSATVRCRCEVLSPGAKGGLTSPCRFICALKYDETSCDRWNTEEVTINYILHHHLFFAFEIPRCTF